MTSIRAEADTANEGWAPSRAGRGRRLVGVSLGYFMILLDMTVLSVAEPDIARAFSASVSQMQWLVDGYTVALAGLLLSSGAAADRFGTDRVFRIGAVFFGALSVAGAFAPSVPFLIVIRVLLGVAAALCIPAATGMITRLYPVPASRARALATWTAISGAGMASGPLVGALLVHAAGWPAVFLVNGPIAIIVVLLVWGRSPSAGAPARRIDYAAQLLVAVTLALLSGSLIAVGGHEYPTVAVLAGAAVCAAGITVFAERRSSSPAFAPELLRASGVVPALLAGAAVNFALTGTLFVLPLLLASRLHLPAIAIGLTLLPLTIPCAVNPLVAGRIVARHGARIPICVGLCLVACGCTAVGFAFFFPSPLPSVWVGLAAIGFGMSTTLPALLSAVLTVAPASTGGSISGLLNAARQMGAALGVAVMGAAVALFQGGQGSSLALIIAVAFTLAALLPWLRRTHSPRRSQP